MSPPAGPSPAPSHPDVFIHPSSVVDAAAQIGAGTRIWHFCHVMAGAIVGRNCVLGQNVFVADGAVVGSGSKIQNNVSIYSGIILGAEVFCGPSMVFTNVRTPRAHVERKQEFAVTHVGRGATFGANCTIICGHQIGEFSLIAAGAVVTGPVPAYALVVGVPARIVGWVCRCGERLDVPASPAEDTSTCIRCEEEYETNSEGVRPCCSTPPREAS